MGEICIVSINTETNHHTDANSRTSLYSLNNASYLVLVRDSETLKEKDAQK